MLSDDVAGGVSCSLMSVPAPGSAGREWASAAEPQPLLAGCKRDPASHTLPGPGPPRRGKQGPTPSLPRIHRGNLANFLRPWHRDSLPWPRPTTPATSPRRKVGTAQVSRGCAGRRRLPGSAPTLGPEQGRGELCEGKSACTCLVLLCSAKPGAARAQRGCGAGTP